MAKTYCYLRVSSKNGRQKTGSQKHALQSYCRTHRITRPVWLSDKETGRKMSRPAFDDLMEACRDGRCSQVLVWRIDRLGRSAVGVCRVIDELLRLGVALVIVHNGMRLDGRDPMGVFTIRLMAMIGELENDIRSSNIRAGLANRKANGKPIGARPQTALRRKLAKWQAEGKTQAEMAQRLHKSPQAVSQMLQRMKGE